MKIAYYFIMLIGSYNLLFALTPISPTTDPFAQPGGAELPCLVGDAAADGVQGVIQYNTTYSPLLAINPVNPNMVVAAMNQGLLQVMSGLGSSATTMPRTQEVAIAMSSNGGSTWSTGINVPLHLCLDSNALSNGQSLSALRYAETGTDTGTVFLAGSYCDVQNQVDPQSNSGIWVATSNDGGATWDPVTIVSTQASNVYQTFVGTSDGTPDLAVDSHQKSNVFVAWDRPQYAVVQGYPNTIPVAGNIFFSRSNNFGNTWKVPTQIYNITKDIPAGGQCTGVSIVAAVKKEKTKALVTSFMRYYKKPGATTFDKTVNTTFTDRVVLRSTNGGGKWEHYARIVSPFIYAQAHDPTESNPPMPTFPAPDGSEKSHMVVNPTNGRVYLLWQAGSVQVSDPTIAQYNPEIVISVSSDHGKEWSNMATVSRTPKELLTTNPSAYQAFNGNIVFLPNNLIGIIYYDFRNFVLGSSAASCDAWLAVYKETPDVHGGNTRIGLDFLSEVRITNPSFDATIATTNSVNGIVSGLGDVLGVAAYDQSILTAIAIPLDNDPANIVTEQFGGFEASVDTNSRLDVQFEKVLVTNKGR